MPVSPGQCVCAPTGMWTGALQVWLHQNFLLSPPPSSFPLTVPLRGRENTDRIPSNHSELHHGWGIPSVDC